MTFRVHESGSGRRIQRDVTLDLLVCPGAVVPTGQGNIVDAALTASELTSAVAVIRRQIDLVFGRSFELPLNRPRGATITYRFTFNVTPTSDRTPVNWSEPIGDSYQARPTPGGRTHASALAEAANSGVPNLAIVYPRIRGNPCAPRVDSAGQFHSIVQSREYPGSLAPVSNTIVLDYELIRPHENRTVAHEVGHLFGMADWQFPGPQLMCNTGNQPRSFTSRDENRFHDSMEFTREGRLVAGAFEARGQGTDPDTAARRRR